MTDVSGFSVTITPTLATSKILVICSTSLTGVSNGVSTSAGFVNLVRGSTSLNQQYLGDFYSGSTPANHSLYLPYSVQHVDSPNTTSSVTYKLQIQNFNATSFAAGQVGQIIAMEILV